MSLHVTYISTTPHSLVFFFNDTATTEIYTLSLHDALPISRVVARARIPVRIDTKKIAGGKTTGETAAQSFSLAHFTGIILYTAILLYGINVMSSVLEEKTTRIVEVLVSSLRPFQLMLGKVLGVGAVSIFQFLIWGVSARLLFTHRPAFLTGRDVGEADQIFQVPHVSGATAAVFITYFLGGFFFYFAMFP